MDGEEPLIIFRNCNLAILQIQWLLAGPMANALPAAGPIDQDAPHRLSGRIEKMRSIFKRPVVSSDEAHPSFMNECRGLQRLLLAFASHLIRSQFAQLIINSRQQFLSGTGVV